jgi:hypothetical protein
MWGQNTTNRIVGQQKIISKGKSTLVISKNTNACKRILHEKITRLQPTMRNAQTILARHNQNAMFENALNLPLKSNRVELS